MVKLSVTREGTGPECLFFVHGWPDDASLWDAQVSHLKQQFTCLRVTMPQFSGREEATKNGHNRPWGFDFPEIAEMIACAIREECDGKQVVLVLHDWGCVWGFLVQQNYPELVKAIVAMDVGLPFALGDGYGWRSVPGFFVYGIVYQYWLLSAYMMSQLTAGTIFEKLGRFVADSMVGMLIRIFRPNAKAVLQGNRITADACFPYYWCQPWGVAGGALPAATMRPSCPVLFFYAIKKPLPFHGRRWEEELKSREDCEVVALPCGHWLQIEYPEAVSERVQSWLEKTLR